MSKPFPPDDDLGPEMTPLEAYSRVMRLKLEINRKARAASKVSAVLAPPSKPSEAPAADVSAEELDQAILDRFPGLTKEDLERIADIS